MSVSFNVWVATSRLVKKLMNILLILSLFGGFLGLVATDNSVVSMAMPNTPDCGNFRINISPSAGTSFGSSISGNNMYVTNTSNNSLMVIDVTTNTVTTTIPMPFQPRNVVNLNGSAYVVSVGSNTLVEVDESTNTIVNNFALPANFSNMFVYQDKIYLGLFQTLQVFNTLTNTLEPPLALANTPLMIGAINNKIYFTNPSNVVNVLDYATSNILTTINTANGMGKGVFIGNMLYMIATFSNSFRSINTTTDTLVDSFFMPGLVSDILAKNNFLYIKGQNNTILYEMDTTNANSIRTVSTSGGGDIILHLDGKLIVDRYFSGFQSSLIFLDDTTLEPRLTLTLPSGIYTHTYKYVDNKLYIGSQRDVIVVDLMNENLLQPCTIPTLGLDYPSVAGGVLGQQLPTIVLSGCNLPNGTVASFLIDNVATPLAGTIQGGNFVPNPGQNIPLNAIVGNSDGVLSSAGVNSIAISTNFIAPPTLGNQFYTTNNRLIGTVGDTFPSVVLDGTNLPDGTVASFKIDTYTIPGTVIDGFFEPNVGQIIPLGVTTGFWSGLLTSAGVSSLAVETNFAVVSTLGTPSNTNINPLFGYLGDGFPDIILSGSNLPNGTVANFTPSGSSNIISGTIVDGNFVANQGEIIPFDSAIGGASGLLSSANVSDVVVATDFSHSPTSDRDGDGLFDIVEDVNNNNSNDIGEPDLNNSDSDSDGLGDGEEKNTPNQGDSDGDSIQDNTQSNVGGVTLGSSFASLALSGNCSVINNIEGVLDSGFDVRDSEFVYSSGFVNFKALG